MTTKTCVLAGLLLFPACGLTPTTGDDEAMRGVGDMWAGEWVSRAATRQALLSQSAVYPYHFVTNSAELNVLGRTELRVLAEHMRAAPGTLYLPRGGQSEALYDDRVATIRAHLVDHGVTADIPIIDGPSPMRGASGSRNVEILTEPNPLSTANGGTSVSVIGP